VSFLGVELGEIFVANIAVVRTIMAIQVVFGLRRVERLLAFAAVVRYALGSASQARRRVCFGFHPVEQEGGVSSSSKTTKSFVIGWGGVARAQSSQKWSKLVKIGQKWSKMAASQIWPPGPGQILNVK
jgi:hypothetical protein